MQGHIIVQVADFSEINKHVGLNKGVYEGLILIYVGENQVLKEKNSEDNNCVGPNKGVQVKFYQNK